MPRRQNQDQDTKAGFDVVIIGSGFGGSVPALRLTEKGYRVAVVEQGRRISPADMRAADRSMRSLFWLPKLGFRGFFVQHPFKHVGIVGGVGVGGGSLVYAAVLLRPSNSFFEDPSWAGLGVDWRAELAAPYEQASSMLGVVTNPDHGKMDDWLRATAEAMDARDTFGPVQQGIYFGKPGKTSPDPFFGGAGPERTGCTRCGRCLTGCAEGSKNSLDKNYLYLAEAKGAQILPERKAVSIRPLDGGGYEVQTVSPYFPHRKHAPLRAKYVILAGGVIGTLELLFRCRDELRTLPRLSDRLGKLVRTNSEAIVAALAPNPDEDLTHGAAISSHFYVGGHTHITQNRFPPGYEFMRWYQGPLVDGHTPVRRAMRTLAAIAAHPVHSLRSWFARNWHKRIVVLTVMQSLDNQIAFRFRRGLLWPFRRRLASDVAAGAKVPAYIPEANEAARKLAEHIGGTPHNTLLETLGNASVTAHILGGCAIGAGPHEGVIDTDHEVFGHPGLFITDAAAIPANVGVNPSLTIAALAERFSARFPSRCAP
ncbi:MAG TPA: GMC family oxidoreductase [Polyangiales bacterium]|nr:GMC family oxidoreductase [Polyangiales bacterium]